MRIIESVTLSRMWPLDGPVGGMFVWGRTFREWQAQCAPEAEVSLVENAWVAAEDWERLLGVEEPAVLETGEGEVLAWSGEERRPGDAVVVMASAESLVVRFPWDLLTVNAQLAAGAVESVYDGPFGKPVVDGILVAPGSSTRILPGVFVEGTVIIGDHCTIGPNCYLRGSTAIGDGCHIGQAVEIKNSIIGAKTSVGHLSYVGDSVLGSRINFGAGTIAGNRRHDGKNHRSMVEGELVETGRRKLGTIVGDAAQTGIHTAIYPGRKLGPGTMTLPGEVVERDVR
jgi:bifunctional UDP-N-acetylglucosamine pyrophosphorylase/glucosamine-1-phosphate N-acetyltransferase